MEYHICLISDEVELHFNGEEIPAAFCDVIDRRIEEGFRTMHSFAPGFHHGKVEFSIKQPKMILDGFLVGEGPDLTLDDLIAEFHTTFANVLVPILKEQMDANTGPASKQQLH